MIKGSFKFYAFCSSLAVFLSAPSGVLGMRSIVVKSKNKNTVNINTLNPNINTLNPIPDEKAFNILLCYIPNLSQEQMFSIYYTLGSKLNGEPVEENQRRKSKTDVVDFEGVD